MSAPLLATLSALYLGLLFLIAWAGDRKPVGQYSRYQPLLYSLSLAVYCSSWTFYGAVGTAASSGWAFISIYLGPLLLFLFGQRLLGKVVRIAKRKRTTSIADFIATRHGNSQAVAALVTVLALLGTIPYIALQLKAVSATFNQLAAVDISINGGIITDTALYVSLILALFAILFGARRIDATEHHRGMIHAVSFESLVKLLALCCVALFAWAMLSQQQLATPLASTVTATFERLHINGNFVSSTLLAACAMLCLPRQFQVLAVESRGDELKTARWAFSGYLVVISLAVIPITLYGLHSFGTARGGDMFVLSLPMAHSNSGANQLLATFVYLGGLSAATGMVIVATVALSTMISNDLALPLVLKYSQRQRADFYPLLLALRRAAIVVIMLLAFSYYRATAGFGALASIGILAFAAAAQIAPAMLGGLYWRGGHRHGALVAISAGSLLWFYTLMLPTLIAAGWLDSALLSHGPWQQSWLRPTALFGIDFADTLTHGVFWSLSVNGLCYWLFSRRAKPNLTDRLQAASFFEGQERVAGSHSDHQITVGDIRELCRRFVGNDRTARFVEQLQLEGTRLSLNSPASAELLKQAEKLLASSIGSASARNIIETAIQVSSDQTPADLLDLLDQTSAAIQFNRGLLQATLDNISQGVSAIDQDLNLVAWNRPYLDLFAYPKDFIHVGMPIAEVIKLNLQRGMIGEESVDKEVARRLMHMRNGTSYSVERMWRGRVLRFQGNPMPDGGYVTTFTDITDLVAAQRELEQTNSNLEQLVAKRTRSLSQANSALQHATREAERATASKTRFLAAASHDLLQPLNAGKLFIGALQEPDPTPLEPRRQQLAKRAMASLQSAESLLRALLDISKLDAGALQPNRSDVAIAEVLAPLASEFAAIAADKGLVLKVRPCRHTVHSDPQLLRSILQNFIANAVRYTDSGRILIACRRRKGQLVIEVRDSGPGIDESQQQLIFNEFHRLANSADTQGLGLGLAIAQRIAALLNHPLALRSLPQRGSTFTVQVPLGTTEQLPLHIPQQQSAGHTLRELRVLCVDDQADIVEASLALLHSWGAQATGANRFATAQQRLDSGEQFDIVIADYRLDAGRTGLALLERYCASAADSSRPAGVIISAEQGAEIAAQIEEAGFYFMAKPVDPQQLRALLAALMRMRKKTP